MFYFIFLHFPLSGPVLINISLPIIPCMIMYVTNNKEPWKAREGEESPDALKGASYQPPRFRRTITPVVYAPSRGVQLGRIAVSL